MNDDNQDDSTLKIALERDLLAAMIRFQVRYPDVMEEKTAVVLAAWEIACDPSIHPANDPGLIIH